MSSLTLFELADPPILVSEIFWWATAALLITYVVVIEGKQLASLGIEKPSTSTITTAAVGFGLALCGVAAFGIITSFIGLETNSTEERLDQTASAPIWWLIIVFLRAGVVEELFSEGSLFQDRSNLAHLLFSLSSERLLCSSCRTHSFGRGHL